MLGRTNNEKKIIEAIEALKKEHYDCPDSWYSCPLSEDGCCDDSKPKDVCTCNVEAQHKQVDSIIESLKLKEEK